METRKIFVINGGQVFGHSGGRFNRTVFEKTIDFFAGRSGFEVRSTDINEAYDPAAEVEKYVWADVVIYHTPVWWFQVPHRLKEYIDVVFTAGHQRGIYRSDGRSAADPAVNYGTGGSLHGRRYMLTTSWNAPATAFTLPGEFFDQHSVDEGPMFGFHRMNAFVGLKKVDSFHFFDVMKNPDMGKFLAGYELHLEAMFIDEKEAVL